MFDDLDVYDAYEAVLFDMDGVVADTEASVARFWQELAASSGRSLTSYELDQYVFGRHASNTLDALFPEFDVAAREEVYSRLEEYECNLTYSEIPGAVRLVHKLGHLAIPCALVTGANYWKADTVASQLDLQDYFATRVTSGEVSKGKPDPEGYLLAAHRLGIPPDKCIAFEDAESGVRAAVAAGAFCVGVGSITSETVLLRSGASVMVPDLRSISVHRDQMPEVDGVAAYLGIADNTRTFELSLKMPGSNVG